MLSRRKLLLAAPALILPGTVLAQRSRVISAPDPGHIFYETPGIASTTPFKDTSGKTPRATTINPVEDTLVMICAGQSLPQNIITDTYSIVNPTKIDNYVWWNGANYAASVPLLGTAWNGSIGTSLSFNLPIADGLISNGKFDRVIIAPCNMAGTTVQLWAQNGVIAEATGYYRCIQAIALKLAAQGITPSTPGVKFLVKWNQGESDTQAGTSQANYTLYLNQLKALVSAVLPGVKWTIATESWLSGTTSSAVQAAQAAAVDNVLYFAGENMDSIGSGGRVGDNTHLNASGGSSAATMGIAAITAITF